MPQMAPISWTLLFIYFSTLIIISIIVNFFIFKNSNSWEKGKSSFKTNWKW